MANMVMQLASIESPQAQQYSIRFVELMRKRNVAMGLHGEPFTFRASGSSTRLRILWMSADICDHPVGRFLYGYFAASQDNHVHEHIVVSWSSPHENPFHGYFASLRGVQFVNAHGYSALELYRLVRGLDADIAIDLIGWTAKNFGNGFLARLAPLQINYLGYYASTGNPSIDVWLGDEALFPTPMREWHTESVHRLSRCFIAWEPPGELPEAQLGVPPSPEGYIRFGSFNHNRKISDPALSLWARIIQALPQSQLVLKATAPGDDQTLELLKQRMIRHGLDTDRVLWLPLVKENRDHLLQYAEMDVALDSFPNGGCTTTCEALWMGVPVITLTGHSYVSRMSTAVLRGAGLHDWCATTQEHYLQLAVDCAGRLNELRQNRAHWRAQLVNNKIGDAADLMQHLELALSQLYREYSLLDVNKR
jgi:predicted O-linked N-acetylglucosamine transferase (SPINDLY family)